MLWINSQEQQSAQKKLMLDQKSTLAEQGFKIWIPYFGIERVR